MSQSKMRVDVVDDDRFAREALVDLLRANGIDAAGYECARRYLGEDGREPPACLLLDVQMPGLDGLSLQRELARKRPAVPIVFVSGVGTVPMSVRAMRAGAIDFLLKPVDESALLTAVRRAMPLVPSERPAALRSIVGDSMPMRSVLSNIVRVAATDATVLIEGETGTGKEMVARAVHELSERRSGPFVKVNCAAIPATLLESELMGHEKGAFTGALARRIGRFEQASGGTIFLDEIGEMALSLQPKLLRILQEREFERVGGTSQVRVDVRIVAATNRSLSEMADAGEFREDLYFRLSVFPIVVPPLRERRDDIPLLVSNFLRSLSGRLGKPLDPLPSATMDALVNDDWPGNIRELQNVLERGAILADNGRLELPTANAAARRSPVSRGSDDLTQLCKEHILRVLDDTNWVIAGPRGAAARLQIKRSTLHARMRKLGILRPAHT